jgi:peptidoglycan/xylan/chitin deacetylase (PgdA/CDA1 family)
MDKPALISLTFDDGLRCQLEQAVPILDQYGFPATFFLVANPDLIHTDGFPHPDWRKTNWCEEDIRLLKGMVQRGHEIGAHSVHHRHPFLDNDAKGEAENSKRWIQDRLGVEIPSYCYPFCYFTEPIKNAVISAGYKQARWGATRVYLPEQGPTDFHKVNCRHIAINDPAFVVVDGVRYPVGRDGSEDVSTGIASMGARSIAHSPQPAIPTQSITTRNLFRSESSITRSIIVASPKAHSRIRAAPADRETANGVKSVG